MTQASPFAIFTLRTEQNQQQEQVYRQQSGRVGWLRLVMFLAGVSGTFYLFRSDQYLAAWLTLAAFYLIFLTVLRWHQRLRYKQQHHAFLKQINLAETDRLQGKIQAFDTGERYANAHHPYTSDLDIFGSHSLFQLLNRAVTAIGKDKLANWLQQPAPADIIIARQTAIAELVPALDWRQQLQAQAMHYKQKAEEPLLFFRWLHEPDFYQNKAWLKGCLFILPLATLLALVGWWQEWVSYYPAGALVLTQYLLCYRYQAARDAYYEQSSGMYEVLRSYQVLLSHIERLPVQAPLLQEWQSMLRIKGKPASGYFQELAGIIEYLSARLNTFMSFLLNNILMWDFFWMYRLENWKKNMATNLEPVLQAVSDMEALASLAAFNYANPAYAVPEMSRQPFEIQATELGHPLIFAASRITNNFSMAGAGQTLVITGSNMSGKSTFLRTVGINLVLAFAGAGVSARFFRVYPAQVFTAMRTQDNLAESTSSFYAELKRLKMLLDLTAAGTPVYYLLDEILKGTNSRDRHLGAQALIRQLHRRHASGLISTHDLELGYMHNESPDYIQNYSFNSVIEGDQIIFDYKLQPGICSSFNASKLMQQMGIEL